MTSPTGEGFPKTARIRRRREFLSLGRTGSRCGTSHFVVLLGPTAGPGRLGVTVSRKVGDAVTRNRLKRRIREAFRRHPNRSELCSDVVVIAKSTAGTLRMPDVTRELTTVLDRRPPRTSRS